MKKSIIIISVFALLSCLYYFFCTPEGVIQRYTLRYGCITRQVTGLNSNIKGEYSIYPGCYTALKNSEMGSVLCQDNTNITGCNEKIIPIGPFFIVERENWLWKISSIGSGP